MCARCYPASADLSCEEISVGRLNNNSYLLFPSQGPGILIDAADEADRLLDWIAGRRLQAIITTHRHHDHIGALSAVAAATKVACFSGTLDAAAIEQATGIAQQGLWTGDQVRVGSTTLRVVGLVGHTAGSIALIVPRDGDYPAHIFTGDTLFPGGVGRTANPADFESLYHDVVTQLFTPFPDDTVIHPGHGADTTLGAERPHLAEWLERGW